MKSSLKVLFLLKNSIQACVTFPKYLISLYVFNLCWKRVNEVKETNFTLGPSVKSGARGEIGLLVSDNADYGGHIVIMMQLTSNQSQHLPSSIFNIHKFIFSVLSPRVVLSSKSLGRASTWLSGICWHHYHDTILIIIIILQYYCHRTRWFWW